MIIRIILIASVLAVVLVVLRGNGSHRQLAVRRLSVFAFAGAWIVAVVTPDLLTRLANAVGVGRGTDLLLYALVVAVLVLAAALAQRLSRVEERMARLTRDLAIAQAHASDSTRGNRNPAELPRVDSEYV